jgi:hypothetical protein
VKLAKSYIATKVIMKTYPIISSCGTSIFMDISKLVSFSRGSGMADGPSNTNPKIYRSRWIFPLLHYKQSIQPSLGRKPEGM